ncbi:MAG TPA: arsenate reductase ArsC [Pseudolabrys sp.]|nr:arsenate reductase ArsC [Pseudolabrys sp.]
MGEIGAKHNVLFLGSGNAARSIMAEAILNREGHDKFCALSAGIQAHVDLDPHAVALLQKTYFDVTGLRPKAWTELAGAGAPIFDFIFALSDDAALMPQSAWRGQPIFARWDIPDPARAGGNEAQVQLAYADVFRMLSNRIGILVNLRLHALDRRAIQRQIDGIGKGLASAVAAA